MKGYALIISLLVLLVSTLVGVAALNMSGLELDLAATKRQRIQALACADAARQILQANFQFGVEPTTVTVDQYYYGSATQRPSLYIQSGDYNSAAQPSTETITDDAFSAGARQASNIVNGMRAAGGGKTGQFLRSSVVCTYTDANGTEYQKQIEFITLYSL